MGLKNPKIRFYPQKNPDDDFKTFLVVVPIFVFFIREMVNSARILAFVELIFETPLVKVELKTRNCLRNLLKII